MEKLLELYKNWKGSTPTNVEKLVGAGSNRAYYRLTDEVGETVIGVIGTSRDENHAFIYLAKHFEKRRLPVPHIIYNRILVTLLSLMPYVEDVKQADDIILLSKSCCAML